MANVSCTTVSRVLNNKPDVNEVTRQRILSLIESCNFQRNVFARGIQTNKSNCIGLIIPRELDYILTNSFYAEVIRGIVKELAKHDYYMLFCNTENKEDIVNIYKQRRVDGFIMIRLGIFDQDVVEVLKAINAPYTSTTTISEEDDILHVDIRNFEAACTAVEYLVSLGHSKIGMVVAANSLTNSKQRFAAYRDTLLKYNLEFDESLVAEGDTSMQGGYSAMKKILHANSGTYRSFCRSGHYGDRRNEGNKGRVQKDTRGHICHRF